MPTYEIIYGESVGGSMSETVEADQFGDAGPFIDFLATQGDEGVVRQVLRIRAEHVDRIQLVSGEAEEQ